MASHTKTKPGSGSLSSQNKGGHKRSISELGSESNQARPEKRLKTFSCSLIQNSNTTTSTPSNEPFVVEFPQGPPSAAALSNGAHGAQIKLLARDGNSWHNAKLVAETQKIQYTGKISQSDANTATYFIGVHHVPTGEIKLVPVSNVSMEQTVKNLRGDKRVKDHKFKNADTKTTREALIEAFASKRLQAANKRMKENYITEDNVIGMSDQLEEQKEKMQQAQLATSAPTKRTDLPTYDETTDQVSEIYDIDNIIPETDFQLLSSNTDFYDAIQELENSNKLDLKETVPSFVESRLNEIRYEGKSDEEVRTFCTHLHYLSFLIRFYRFSPASRGPVVVDQRSYSKAAIPAALFKSLMEKFTQCSITPNGPKYTRTSSSNLKIIRHACVLALLLSKDYTVNVHPIAKDLQLTVAATRVHFQNVGCVIRKITAAENVDEEDEPEGEEQGAKKSNKGYYIAVLKAPIKFPIIRLKTFSKRN